MFYKVDILRNLAKLSGKYQRRSLFNEVVGRRPQAYYFIEKETPAQVEICRILKNIFFMQQLWMTVFRYIRIVTAKKFPYQSSSLAKVIKRQKEEGEGKVNYSSLHTSTIKGVL